jgi:hypothetical protein
MFNSSFNGCKVQLTVAILHSSQGATFNYAIFLSSSGMNLARLLVRVQGVLYLPIVGFKENIVSKTVQNVKDLHFSILSCLITMEYLALMKHLA